VPVAKLGPWSGVDARTIDDRVLNTNPIRGGYNVEIHGGELWWRQGFARLNHQTPIPLQVSWENFVSDFVEGTIKEYLVSRYAVLEILSNGTYSIPYNATVTNNVTFVAGSTTVVASAVNWVLGDIVNDPFTNNFYIIVGGAGTLTGTLDRPAAVGGTVATSRFAQLSASPCTDACFFKNDITHAANAVWVGPPGNLATAPGEVYLVLCFRDDKPVAIRVDAAAAMHREFFRDTSPAAGAAVAITKDPIACCVHESRLILAGGGDFAGNNDGYCWWYSMPRDLMGWHTGIQAVDATPNTIRLVEDEDPITAARTLSDRLIIHRKYSQEVVSYTGAIDIPYRLERNEQVLGCGNTYQLAVSERRHFLMTHRGPAIFDGSEVRLFGDEVKDIFDRAGLVGTMGPGDNSDCEVWSFDASGRVIFTTIVYEDGDSTLLGYSSGGNKCLVYDVATGQWSAWALPGTVACAGSSSRKEGTLANPQYRTEIITITGGEILSSSIIEDYQYGFDHWGSKSGQTYTRAGEIITIMPGLIRTGWYDFGSSTQKMVTKLEIELRDTFRVSAASHRGMLLPTADNEDPLVSFILQLNVYRDFDLLDPVETLDIIVPSTLFNSADNPGRGWGVEPIRKIRRSLRSQGDVFAFEFSNLRTNASIAAAYQEGVFRIVQAMVTFTDTGSPRRVNVEEGRPR
jgi:hypothetical protein